MSIDVAALYPKGAKPADYLNDRAATMIGSRILGIAAQVKELQAAGEEVCDLTIGDFSPAHFQAPEALRRITAEQLEAGNTNYPPADGLPVLRKAIVDFYEARLGLRFPIGSIVVGSGARPPLYAALACLLEPGETYVYAVPSWNNEYYVHLNGATAIEVPTRVEDGFMPTLEDLAPHLPVARVLHLNTPLNPCGTCISPEALEAIARAVVDENRQRAADGRKPLMLLFDMVYWLLTYRGVEHADPIKLVPEVAPYVIYIDAISKWMAATGLRVGWGVVPEFLQGKMKALIGHIGAWAPRPEQEATAWLLNHPEVLDPFLHDLKGAVQERLDLIYDRVQAMAAEGLPAEAVAPQGAIYLSVRFNLVGRTLPDGTVAKTNDQIREYLLREAGIAMVPFRAFGLQEENGWFRMSVGAVGVAELGEALDRVAVALRRVR